MVEEEEVFDIVKLRVTKYRYVHLKKTIFLTISTAKQLRYLAKECADLEAGEASQKFQTYGCQDIGLNLICCSLFLIKKAVLLNDQGINTIKKRKNTFRLNQFEFFLDTESAINMKERLE